MPIRKEEFPFAAFVELLLNEYSLSMTFRDLRRVPFTISLNYGKLLAETMVFN